MIRAAFIIIFFSLYSLNISAKASLNIDAKALEKCSSRPMTGFNRDGYCNTNEFDKGTHVVCAQVTNQFLLFSKTRGNDLITPRPRYRFPGLKHGDYWCLCALRWLEAEKEGFAPKVKIGATHIKALEYIDKDVLK